MMTLTKAQARKRLQEARKKVAMVAFEFPHITTGMFNDLTKIAVKLDSMVKKLK